jgi:hypothetical protein
VRAIILGGAESVWDDVDALEELWGRRPWDGITIAVNDIACHRPRRRSDWIILDEGFSIDHWCTLHPEKLADWMALRDRNGLPAGYRTWSHKREPYHSIRGREFIDHTLPIKRETLSSGLFACYVAKELGVEGYLCGIPMTSTPHFAGSREHEAGVAWVSAAPFWDAWLAAFARGELSHIRSMSGRTRELLGAPTPPPPSRVLPGAAASAGPGPHDFTS